MTELEQRLIESLEQEKQDREREKKELHVMLTSIADQQSKIIDILKAESNGSSLEETLEKVFNRFSRTLTESLEVSLTQSLEASLKRLTE